MMMRRRGGPGIIGIAATTAVMAGTAGAVRHRQEQRYASKDAEQQAQLVQQQQAEAYQQQMAAQQAAAYQQQMAAQQAAAYQQQMATQQAAPAPAPAAPAAQDDLIAQLKQLGDLKAAGILSEEEFATAKAKLLG